MPDPIDGLDVALDVASVVNDAQVTVYPVETVGALATLWQARTVLKVDPGDTRTIFAPFRDENGERVGAVDVVTPVAGTDYTVNEYPDGSGPDYTYSARFTLTATTEATRMEMELGNTAIGPLYVTLLKVRGKPLRTWDPIVVTASDSSSQTAYQTRTRALALTMQTDPVFAQSYADYLVNRFADPYLAATRLTLRDRATVDGVNIFGLDLMDRVRIYDDQAGLDGTLHRVRGVEYELGPRSWTATLHLEHTSDRDRWVLGRAGYSELGSTTRLGF